MTISSLFFQNLRIFFLSCHSGNLKASSVLLSMGIDKFVAGNAIRLSVGRETTKSQIDLIIEDLKQSVNGLLGS